MEQLDIVKLIEETPITKLSKDYNVKLLTKIKENFTNFEQQLFLSSFYCYLNCEPIKEFVIDLDDVWKWLEFSSKQKALRIVEKYFIINTDYIQLNLLNQLVKQDEKTHGGHNKEKFMLNINTFKNLCLKAQTKKADEIHKYYLKLEQILHQTIDEENDELKLQLQNKDKLIDEKDRQVELALISQFPVNTECIYFGTIDIRIVC